MHSIELDRNDEARDTTKALVDFYRIMLNKGRELITLEKEAQITDDYLTILQIRYPDVFRYEVDIPPELAGTPIPKLSLQPLVENSIYHGLKKKGTKGFIRIVAFNRAIRWSFGCRTTVWGWMNSKFRLLCPDIYRKKEYDQSVPTVFSND